MGWVERRLRESGEAEATIAFAVNLGNPSDSLFLLLRRPGRVGLLQAALTQDGLGILMKGQPAGD